ncbi:DUF4259 domain-containing protein [Paenibacillus polymyxa]
MGAWGYGIFENDDVMDWKADLLDSEGIEFLQESIHKVLEEEYIESDVASIALGAVEILAALHGKPSNEINTLFEYTEDLEDWIKQHSGTGIYMKDIAKQAIKRILEESELKELWDETEEYHKWESTIKELEKRIEELN